MVTLDIAIGFIVRTNQSCQLVSMLGLPAKEVAESSCYINIWYGCLTVGQQLPLPLQKKEQGWKVGQIL